MRRPPLEIFDHPQSLFNNLQQINLDQFSTTVPKDVICICLGCREILTIIVGLKID